MNLHINFSYVAETGCHMRIQFVCVCVCLFTHMHAPDNVLMLFSPCLALRDSWLQYSVIHGCSGGETGLLSSCALFFFGLSLLHA